MERKTLCVAYSCDDDELRWSEYKFEGKHRKFLFLFDNSRYDKRNKQVSILIFYNNNDKYAIFTLIYLFYLSNTTGCSKHFLGI